ncbi:MAG: sigma-54 dependent transcriptional regulator [Chromatiales bacterium]|nr:sigma-54 dependent transcriptional regulator [Chromatiales bacterium]
MQQPLALIVDDEPDIRELLSLTLSRMAINSREAETLREAKELLQSTAFDLCLTDMRLPDGNGIDLIRHIQQSHSELPVAMITAHGNMDTAIEALKAGAFDFLNKPVELQALRELVHSALRLRGNPIPSSNSSSELQLLGHSAAIESIRQMITKLARSQAPVYISGESGTGKELVARLIHAQGPRAEMPFIAVNCGAIPSELMESEFFGHKRGSFTGANSDKEGLFQAANGGTLFLDEVADLPLDMQVKLLRAIQEKAVRPVGAQQEKHVDVRILSATHKDLAKLVASGHFREDLFFRINVIELRLPSLRERPEDIPLLAGEIMKRLATEMGISPPHLEAEALLALQHHPFNGNVRELENTLERALTLSEGTLIDEAALQLPASQPTSSPQPPSQYRSSSLEGNLEEHLERIERQLIERALEESAHNKTAAAKALGISFRSLRYRLQKLGIE